MATRTDVDINYNTDPRLIRVDAPSVEISIQDLHDTLSVIDSKFASMSHPHTLTTTGKQNLGGGVLVGLTLQLENAQLSFERRSTLISSGTITTAGTIGAFFQTVIDSPGATFIADGVARGYIVINLTDNSKAEVISIDSETQLTVLSPTGGAGNDYGIGDSYEVWLHETCNISGGNMVAVEADGVTPITSTFPTFGVGIVRTSASSATLQEQADIQFASFNGGVTIDVLSSNTGTLFPVGTPREPVNNTVDAHTILTTRGFDTFFIKGDITIDNGVHPHLWKGQAPSLTTITLDPTADVTDARFMDATVTGTLDNDAQIKDCTITALNIFNGKIETSIIDGTLTLGGGVDALIVDSWSGLSGTTIDYGGSGQSALVQNFNGSLTLTNKTGADLTVIGLGSGDVTIDNSVTTGTVELHGVGRWENELTYTGGATIINELVDARDLQHMSFHGGVHLDIINGTSGVSYPRGTQREPVDNLTDAKAIAATNNFATIFILGDFNFISTDILTGFVVVGESIDLSAVDIDVDAVVNTCEFSRMTLTGTIDNDTVVSDCLVDGLDLRNGTVVRCQLKGTIAISGTADLQFINCASAVIGTATPVIDMGGDGPALGVRGYNGGLALRNKTGSGSVSIDLTSGQVIVEDTVTTGTILLRGVGKWTNKTTYIGGANVVDELLSSPNIIAELDSNTYDGVSFSDLMIDLLSMASGRIVEGPADTFKFYERDSSTVRFTLTKTANERNRS